MSGEGEEGNTYFFKGRTRNTLTLWNAFVSVQVDILDDIQSVQLGNGATAATTTTTSIAYVVVVVAVCLPLRLTWK